MEIEKYIKISSISVGSAVYSKVSIDEKGKYWLKHRNDGIIIHIILKISNDF